MKYLKLILSLIMIFTVCACSKGEFCTLTSFIDDFCSYIDTKTLQLEDFRISYNNDNTNYYTFIAADECELLLSIDCDKSGKVFACKLLAGKIDSTGKTKSLSIGERMCFTDTLEIIIQSFCRFNKDKAENLLKEFSLYDEQSYSKQGELTKTDGNFRFVYYSTSLMSEMIITNTHLKETVPTEKPESKPYFAQTPSVRTETVPLR